ncbi:hypothetical protein ACFQ1E_04050 [Sphingomonas canadensis]|uniref:Uncharacterized protein n=1 Tax=Sphingomonas canadensis TaxID=1219257 RepID=A0ABW3H2Y1_9SPHN|nr:hypothetical protein [Sphingomonas canadensis]MCW3834583.1 hypothetical protein [Sphingomonas canadensis]
MLGKRWQGTAGMLAFAVMATVTLVEGTRPPRLPKPEIKAPALLADRDAAGAGGTRFRTR